jgi:hypothetical protein
MKFLHLFRNISKPSTFDNIQDYEDVKNIVRRALDSPESYNLIFIGPSASGKTLFLDGITCYKDAVFFDGSNTTSKGTFRRSYRVYTRNGNRDNASLVKVVGNCVMSN